MVGCGYKPLKRYTHDVLGEKIYTHVSIYLRDPENAVLIRDAVNEAILDRFGRSLVKEDQAQSKIYVTIAKVYFTPLEYDKYGYVIYYRNKVILRFTLVKDGKKRTITTSGLYDFPIEPNSIITDTLRYIAIKESATKAIDRFISRIGFLGAH
jgi:hypothetical protein